MLNINLLPKKSTWEQIYVPLLVIVLLFHIIIVALIFNYSYHIDSATEDRKTKATALQTSIEQLLKQREIDPLTADYNALTGEITKLKNSRRYWIPLFELITSNLPGNARVNTMSANEKDIINLQLEAGDLNQIAEYALLLKNSEMLDSVRISSVTRTERDLSTQGQTKTLDNNRLEGTVMTPDTNYNLPDLNSGDNVLLNQLNSIITQQMVKQQYGVELPLPKASAVPPSPSPTSTPGKNSSPLTKSEIDAAKKSLENFKNPPESLKKTGPETKKVDPSIPVAKKVSYYQVTLDLKVKSLPQGK